MAELQFNEKRHEYTVNGVLVPSVTQILQKEGFSHYGKSSGDAAFRGKAIHQIMQRLDSWQDIGIVPVAYQGYVDAFMKFIGRFKPEWKQIEQPFFSEQLHIAGTPDRITEDAVFDFKTGSPLDVHGLQLAGYVLLIDKPTYYRRNVYLQVDGNYRIIERTAHSDFVVFQNALYNYKWKAAHE